MAHIGKALIRNKWLTGLSLRLYDAVDSMSACIGTYLKVGDCCRWKACEALE